MFDIMIYALAGYGAVALVTDIAKICNLLSK